MRLRQTAANIIAKYFDNELDIRVQVFNLLSFIGIVGGLFVAITAIIFKETIGTILIDFMLSVLSFSLLRLANKKKCYHLCSWIFVVAAFFILFPILFFSCGGYKSGAAYTFIIAWVFTAILLENSERNVALVVELVIYVLCCLLAYFKPELATGLSSDFNYVFMSLVNFIFTGAVVLTAIAMRTRIFYTKQAQVQELNRELTARAETLARYDRMKSDFLATVAHEINTPLAIISACSNDTLDLLAEPTPNIGEIVDNQMVIERRVKMIDSILLDLMDTVSIETGRLSLNRQPVLLSELIFSICSVQHEKLDEHNNCVIFDFQENLPKIWVDPSRIEQVMINLLSNAFRYSNNGTIEIKLEQKDGKQIASVSDNGEGMDAEMMRIALRQYVSTKADYWRHGIGLYLCRRIIIAHGGEIWIESKKGSGTTVFFSLREASEYV